jgi:hypothetical protein
MHYARLYDGTVANDYFKAMDRIEGLTVTPVLEVQHVFSQNELFGLLADLKESPLNPEQKAIVSAIQEGVYALVNREHYVP